MTRCENHTKYRVIQENCFSLQKNLCFQFVIRKIFSINLTLCHDCFLINFSDDNFVLQKVCECFKVIKKSKIMKLSSVCNFYYII